jgi:hypothetical protein
MPGLNEIHHSQLPVCGYAFIQQIMGKTRALFRTGDCVPRLLLSLKERNGVAILEF